VDEFDFLNTKTRYISSTLGPSNARPDYKVPKNDK